MYINTGREANGARTPRRAPLPLDAFHIIWWFLLCLRPRQALKR